MTIREFNQELTSAMGANITMLITDDEGIIKVTYINEFNQLIIAHNVFSGKFCVAQAGYRIAPIPSNIKNIFMEICAKYQKNVNYRINI